MPDRTLDSDLTCAHDSLMGIQVPCAAESCTRGREIGDVYCAQHGGVGYAARVVPTAGVTAPPRPPGAAALVCPHCQVRGKVKSKRIKVKRGISGGKATGAVLTAGFSILATGLSRKETRTSMSCGNCKMTWIV